MFDVFGSLEVNTSENGNQWCNTNLENYQNSIGACTFNITLFQPTDVQCVTSQLQTMKVLTQSFVSNAINAAGGLASVPQDVAVIRCLALLYKTPRSYRKTEVQQWVNKMPPTPNADLAFVHNITMSIGYITILYFDADFIITFTRSNGQRLVV